MTSDESRAAILSQWQRLPAWRRRTTQDAVDFAHIMLTSRPDITDFECALDRFLVVRSWLIEEQRSAQAPVQTKRATGKAARLKGDAKQKAV